MDDAGNQLPQHLKRVFYRPLMARVIGVQEMAAKEKVLELEMESGRPLGHAPGQFVQVYVFGHGEAPISVCSSPSLGSFELCVREVGTVSSAIHDLGPSDWVGIRGPYGRGFPMKSLEGNDLLVVAGGIGIAPLRSLIVSALERRVQFRRLIVVYGARDPAAILFKDDLRLWESDPGIEFYIIVDQPDQSWKGRTGVVTLPIRDLEFEPDGRQVAAVVGPPVMYRFVAMELFKKGFEAERIYFSLERRFRCGIGKCGHCQLNDVYVCQDGPVFRYSELMGRVEAVEAWAPDRQQE